MSFRWATTHRATGPVVVLAAVKLRPLISGIMWRMSSPLSHDRIFAVGGNIPPRRVATYGQIARLTGHPRAARHIGYALHRSPPRLAWPLVSYAPPRVSLPSGRTCGLTQRRVLREEW